jgi:hypothetical protein
MEKKEVQIITIILHEKEVVIIRSENTSDNDAVGMLQHAIADIALENTNKK